MAWIRQKQCLNCNGRYDKCDTICPHCKEKCEDIWQSMYGEITIGYKFVDSRILTPEELKKINRRKNKCIKYDNNGFNPRTGLYRDGSRYDGEGYDIEGFNEDGIDRDGYNRKGFNPITRRHKNGSFYDEGYNIDGYNENGYDRDGHPCGRDPIKAQEEEKDIRNNIIKDSFLAFFDR